MSEFGFHEVFTLIGFILIIIWAARVNKKIEELSQNQRKAKKGVKK